MYTMLEPIISNIISNVISFLFLSISTMIILFIRRRDRKENISRIVEKIIIWRSVTFPEEQPKYTKVECGNRECVLDNESNKILPMPMSDRMSTMTFCPDIKFDYSYFYKKKVDDIAKVSIEVETGKKFRVTGNEQPISVSELEQLKSSKRQNFIKRFMTFCKVLWRYKKGNVYSKYVEACFFIKLEKS